MIFKKKQAKQTGEADKRSPKVEPAELNVQGFLVPKHYRRLSKYRNNTIFRSTSLVVLLCLAAGALQVFKYTLTNNNKRISEVTQKLEMEESGRLQQKAAGLRPIKSKFKELEVLRKQLRIPMAPVLDALEKTIPEDISINRITWMCPPVAAGGALKRRATVQVEVYFPSNVNPDDEVLLRWPDALREKLPDAGLMLTQSDWGPQKKFEPTKEQEIKAKEEFGSTRMLTLTIELGV
jgi:hypothetical protein